MEKVGTRDSLIAPGYVARSFMVYMKMTPESFARRLQMSLEDLNRFFAGELPLDKNLAYALKTVTGKPASFWESTEKFYRHRLARIEEIEGKGDSGTEV